MSSFTLKLIGITSMLADHIGKAFFPEQQWLTLIGRLAFPIFAFEIAQGYIHTKNINKYFLRLTIFAFVSQIPYILFNSILTSNLTFCCNVIFTLLFGLTAIFFFDHSSNRLKSSIIIIVLCALAELLQMDYGAYGVIIILLFFFLSRNTQENKDSHKALRIVAIFLVFTVLTILRYLYLFLMAPTQSAYIAKSIIFTLLSFIPILLYNGKLGPKYKYLFYIFYPVHLLILSYIHHLL